MRFNAKKCYMMHINPKKGFAKKVEKLQKTRASAMDIPETETLMSHSKSAESNQDGEQDVLSGAGGNVPAVGVETADPQVISRNAPAEAVQENARSTDGGPLGPNKSNPSRYKPHEKGDPAFKRIEFSELTHVGERGSIGRRTSTVSLGNRRISHITVPTQMRRASVLAKTMPKRGSLRLPDKDMAESKKMENLSPDSKTKGAKISFATVGKILMWRARSREKRRGAQMEYHFKLLKQTHERVSTQLPVPLKILIHEELYPVICQTVKSYEKQLGKTHELTKEAIESRDEMAKWGAILLNM